MRNSSFVFSIIKNASGTSRQYAVNTYSNTQTCVHREDLPVFGVLECDLLNFKGQCLKICNLNFVLIN